MIRFPCPNCGTQLAAPEEKAGVFTRCRFCQAPVCVPGMKVAPSGSNRNVNETASSSVLPGSEKGNLPSFFHPSFLAELKLVYDAEIEKEPDELVSSLAKLFEERRSRVKDNCEKFYSDLKTIFQAECNTNPEEFLPLLSSRLTQWRIHNVQRMREHLSSLPEEDPLHCPISLFGTLGLGRFENAHSSALAWLLDPGKGHGLGTSLIEALLGHLGNSQGEGQVIVEEMVTEHRVIFGKENLGRMDIFGTGTWTLGNGNPEDWLLAIETKVDASEGEKQLDRYNNWIDGYRGNKTVFRVFLTPEGRQPETGLDWTPLSFLELVRIFREPYLRLHGKPGFHFLRYYLAGILMDVCRLKLPLASPETCEDPHGFVEYLGTVRKIK